MSEEFALPSMESFGAMNSEQRDGILLQALQHVGGQFGAMQDVLENLHRENSLLRMDTVQSQGLLHDALL
ncbi:hypothetical protein, partial [Streptomyces humidus]|uniref:hypothetical protein n=1 Tax=Streptomyces humidus TaxID=52259 RepID=UPI00167CABB6